MNQQIDSASSESHSLIVTCFEYVESTFETLSTVLAYFGSFMILCITLLISYNSLSRKLANQSVQGSLELVEYSLVWITFLSAAWILRRDGHVKVDILYIVLPKGVVRVLWYTSTAVAGVATAFMTYYSGLMVYQSYKEGNLLIGQLIFTEWRIMSIIPIGFLMLTIEFIILLFKGPQVFNVLEHETLF